MSTSSNLEMFKKIIVPPTNEQLERLRKNDEHQIRSMLRTERGLPVHYDFSADVHQIAERIRRDDKWQALIDVAYDQSDVRFFCAARKYFNGEIGHEELWDIWEASRIFSYSCGGDRRSDEARSIHRWVTSKTIAKIEMRESKLLSWLDFSIAFERV